MKTFPVSHVSSSTLAPVYRYRPPSSNSQEEFVKILQNCFHAFYCLSNFCYSHFFSTNSISKQFVDKSLMPCIVKSYEDRGGSRAASTSKMECFVKIVNGWKPLTIITKHSILDVCSSPRSTSGSHGDT